MKSSTSLVGRVAAIVALFASAACGVADADDSSAFVDSELRSTRVGPSWRGWSPFHHAPAPDLGVPLSGVASDALLVANDAHTCVVANGTLKCFGRNILGGPTGQYSFDRGIESADMGDHLPAVELGACARPKSIAVGAYHACALLVDGTVRCWGENRQGALGLGDTRHRAAGGYHSSFSAVNLGSGRSARALAAGDGFTCAILDDDTVKCWGSNTYGQLGLGDLEDRGDQPSEMGNALPRVELGTGRRARLLRAGAAHVCAVLDDESLKCWGLNNHGQLGLGDVSGRGSAPVQMGDRLPSVALGAGRTPAELALGVYHTCARFTDDSVKCWGDNTWAQLGLGDTESRGDEPGEMGEALPVLDLGAGIGARSLAVGSHHSCALLEDGGVKCWGENQLGVVGSGSPATLGDEPGEMGDTLPRLDLGSGRCAKKLLATQINTCVELDDGRLKCWGAPWSGMLGIGPSETRGDSPGEMGDALPTFGLGRSCSVRSFASGLGYHFGCALLSDGRIKCWGSNSFGQLGSSSSNHTGDERAELGSNLKAVSLGVGRRVVSAGTGAFHGCALLEDGAVKCWGINRAGALGLGDTVRRDGRPSSMGDNLPAVNLGSGRRAVSLAVGAMHSCAVLDDGTLRCWGDNSWGQLGLGDRRTRGDEPGEMGDALPTVDLGAGRSVRSVAAGPQHTCAILDDGRLKCWGRNRYGQLGVEDAVDHGDEPDEMGDALPGVDLGTDSPITAAYPSYVDTCVLFEGGLVKCWGANRHGQSGLGDRRARGGTPGSMGEALPFVPLGTARTAQALSVGEQHACALLDDGSIKCWGYGAFGKLGSGATADIGLASGQMGDALLPVELGASAPAIRLASGDYHNCALFLDGVLKCWGEGAGGVLGTGDDRSRGALGEELGAALPAVSLGSF